MLLPYLQIVEKSDMLHLSSLFPWLNNSSFLSHTSYDDDIGSGFGACIIKCSSKLRVLATSITAVMFGHTFLSPDSESMRKSTLKALSVLRQDLNIRMLHKVNYKLAFVQQLSVVNNATCAYEAQTIKDSY